MDIKQIQATQIQRGHMLSTLLVGNKGVGKRTLCIDLICEISPGQEEKIREGKSVDILEFTGDESIATVKEELYLFTSSNVRELPYKFLICNNLNYMSHQIASTLLKVIEEKRNFHVLTTATEIEGIQKPLLSRLHRYKIYCPGAEKIREVLSKDVKRQHLLKVLDKYPFKTFFELNTFLQFPFASFFDSCIQEKTDYSNFTSKLDSLLSVLKDSPISLFFNSSKYAAYSFLLDYVCYRIENTPVFHPVRYVIDTMKERFSKTLFAPDIYRKASFVNIETQIRAFLTGLFMLRNTI